MPPPSSALEPACAQRLQDLAMRWQDAWNRHEMDVIAASIAPNVDFVTVAGQWLRGRAEFIEHHRKLHDMQMRESQWTTLGSSARLLGAELALQLVEWRIEGDRDPDGAPRLPRRGVFTWVVSLDAEPTILAAHNTNLAPHVMHRLPRNLTPKEAP